MANIASAKKRARQAVVRREHNQSIKSDMRTSIKRVITAVEAGEKDSAQSAYASAVSKIDKAANKNMIHANKAARHKSRLNKKIAAMA